MSYTELFQIVLGMTCVYAPYARGEFVSSGFTEFENFQNHGNSNHFDYSTDKIFRIIIA